MADPEPTGPQPTGKDAPSRERLDELEERIEKTRRQAEDEVPGMDGDEPRYYESGDTPADEDNQIPPAG